MRMQVQRGKQEVPAKSMTKKEFAVVVKEVSKIMDAKYKELNVDGKLPQFKLAFDNPAFHNISASDLLECHLTTHRIVRPPRYSGDFMQAIETVHANVCAAFQRTRFRTGLVPYDVKADGKLLKDTFFKKVRAAGVQKSCEKVMRLVQHIDAEGTGGYGPSKLC